MQLAKDILIGVCRGLVLLCIIVIVITLVTGVTGYMIEATVEKLFGMRTSYVWILFDTGVGGLVAGIGWALIPMISDKRRRYLGIVYDYNWGPVGMTFLGTCLFMSSLVMTKSLHVHIPGAIPSIYTFFCISYILDMFTFFLALE